MSHTRLKTRVQIQQRGGDKSRHDVLRDACLFGLDSLMSARMANGLQIILKMRAGLRKGTHGQVMMKCTGSKSQKVFVIEIQRDNPLRKQVETLMHELVHVQQRASGRYQMRWWKSDNKLHARWQGQDLGDKNKIPYRQRPWEIEAFEKQGPMARAYWAQV